MTKFNKTLLAAAVAAAVALPGLASAATLGYEAGQQITFAKDLIVNDGTTINTPSQLTLRATSDDASRIGTVNTANGRAVTVKVTLTNGAKFDATADATTFVQNFAVGTQLGGTGAIIGAGALVGTPYYSANGQELNFTFTAPGDGTVGTVATDFALRLNSMQVTNLVQGLFTGNFIGAEVTAQNASGQQILAAGTTIARSVWGLAITSTPTPQPNSRIDVAAGGTGAGAYGRKTRFSPTGVVGGANGAANTLWSPGAIVIDIAQAALTGGTTLGYVNNFSAVAAQPRYNVVATAEMAIDVKGLNLSAFRNNNAFLNNAATCDGPTSLNGTVNAAGDTIAFKAPASSALFANVTNAPPSASTVHVCLRANGTNEMVAQPLSATVNVDYQLSTQRRNPPAETVNLSPLQINGNTMVFQNVNPGANSRAQSFLRITNNTADVCPITLDAKDDAGRLSGEVTFNLPAHASQHFNSDELENGSSKGTGSFGDGTGRWYVRVTAECDSVKASALNRNLDTGVVTNLTPEKHQGVEWLTPSTRL